MKHVVLSVMAAVCACTVLMGVSFAETVNVQASGTVANTLEVNVTDDFEFGEILPDHPGASFGDFASIEITSNNATNVMIPGRLIISNAGTDIGFTIHNVESTSGAYSVTGAVGTDWSANAANAVTGEAISMTASSDSTPATLPAGVYTGSLAITVTNP